MSAWCFGSNDVWERILLFCDDCVCTHVFVNIDALVRDWVVVNVNLLKYTNVMHSGGERLETRTWLHRV